MKKEFENAKDWTEFNTEGFNFSDIEKALKLTKEEVTELLKYLGELRLNNLNIEEPQRKDGR